MREQLADGYVLFAGLREFRPVTRDLVFVSAKASVDGDRETGRRDAFGRRPDIDERVGLPRPLAVGIAMTAPQIDDQFAVHQKGNRRADLIVVLEVSAKGVPKALEAGSTLSFNRGTPCHQSNLLVRVMP
jgi:hypothetical protein